jgi:hypothetical protein
MKEVVDNIQSEKIQAMVKTMSNKVRNLPMENADIQQELYSAIWVYFKENEPEKRTMGAVRRVINQKLYRLIRQNIKFEGCSEKSKTIRRALNMPTSLDQPIFNHEDNDRNVGFTLESVLGSKTEFNHLDYLSLIDALRVFKGTLTSTELTIFNLMLQSINKPRFICEFLYGKTNVNERKCKTISKHMINIKSKFEEYWLKQYGKRLNFHRKRASKNGAVRTTNKANVKK